MPLSPPRPGLHRRTRCSRAPHVPTNPWLAEPLEGRTLLSLGPLGHAFQVNTTPSDPAAFAALAGDARGDFVVAWEARGVRDGSGSGVYARRLDGAGQPRGDAFRVNTTTAGDQSRPAAAMDADGDFVVAWIGEGAAGPGVYAQRFSGAGERLGAELRITGDLPLTAGAASPALAMDADGDFVVAWSRYEPGDGYYDPGRTVGYARRYDAAGRPAGDEFRVGAGDDETEYVTSVAMGADGAFAVAWATPAGCATSIVYARRFSREGTPAGEPFAVTSASISSASVAIDPDGDLLVIWSTFVGGCASYGSYLAAADEVDQFGYHIWARRYDAAGGPPTPVVRVDGDAGDYRDDPVIAVNAHGRYVIAWTNTTYLGEMRYHTEVRTRQFDAADQPLGEESVLSADPSGPLSVADVAIEDDGDLLAAWVSYYEAGVVVRRFEADGQALGSASRVNTGGVTTTPSVAAAADGSTVVAWASRGPDGGGSGVYAQRYGAGGAPVGGEFLVNTTTAGDQSDPAVAMDADGDFVVTWSGVGTGGSGIFARRFSSTGQPLGNEFQVTTAILPPAVAMAASGAFLVAWGVPGGVNEQSVSARRYSADAQPAGAEFVVAGAGWAPSVAMDAGGNGVVAWYGRVTNGSAVFARRVSATGQAGPPIQVSAPAAAYHWFPSVAADPDGDFAVAWLGGQQGGASVRAAFIYSRVFTAAGVPLTDPFLVSAETEEYAPPAVAADADGDWVVTWNYRYGGGRVVARRYGAAAEPRGSQFTVADTPGFGPSPSVAAGAGGAFTVVWNNNGPGGTGIYARRYGQSPAPRVTDVFVGSSGWASLFRERLAAQGLGDARFGYRLDAAGTPPDVLPWINIDRVSVRFDRPVVAAARDLLATGVRVNGVAVAACEYDSQTNTATWILSQPLAGDRVAVTVDGDAGGVAGTNGLRLDGEPSDYLFASGDGSPGGDFRFEINVLPGDTNRSGTVLADDFADLKKKLFSNTSSPGSGANAYSVFHDIDGSGIILANDFSEVKKRFFSQLPAVLPAALARVAAAPPSFGTRSVSEDLLGAPAPVL